ncbi:alpha-amylase family glycosyl hydrolase [Bacillus sp. SL00103]
MKQQTNEPWWKKRWSIKFIEELFRYNGLRYERYQWCDKKLDYIKELGADCIWLTPMYESHDMTTTMILVIIQKIHDMYGTMADFEHMLKEAHDRGIRGHHGFSRQSYIHFP